MLNRGFWLLAAYIVLWCLPTPKMTHANVACEDSASQDETVGCTVLATPRCAHEPGTSVTFTIIMSNGTSFPLFFVATVDMIQSELVVVPPMTAIIRQYVVQVGVATFRLHPKAWCKGYRNPSTAERVHRQASREVEEIKKLLPTHAQLRAMIEMLELSLITAIEENATGTITSLLSQLTQIERNDERNVLTRIERSQNGIKRAYKAGHDTDAAILELNLHPFDLRTSQVDKFAFVPDPMEESPGFRLPKNDDDDNVNGTPDNEENPVNGEKETTQFWWFFAKPIDVGNTFDIDASASSLRVWDDRTKSSTVPLPKHIGGLFSRDRLFLEGNTESAVVSQEQIFGCFFYFDKCFDEILGTVDGIMELEFESKTAGTMDNGYPNYQKDGNPTLPGGDRIFPDKNKPTGNLNDKLKVRATVTPKRAGCTVYFKPFDVDDPTSNEAPVDNEGAPQDNRGAVEGKKEGKIVGSDADGFASAQTDGSGVAEVEFCVTKQPGDNFRVVVGLTRHHLETLQVKPGHDGQANVSTQFGAPVLTTGPAVGPTSRLQSRLLTVWRQLHIEVDSMEQEPSDTAKEPDIKNLIAESITPNAPIAGQSTIDTFGPIFAPSVDHYEGGEVGKLGVNFLVLSHTRNLFLGDQIIVSGVPTPAQIALFTDQVVQIRDDDLLAPPQLPKDTVLTPFISDAFRRAFIEAMEVGNDLNTDNRVDFDLYIDDVEFQTEAGLGVGFAGAREVDSTEDYWAHLVVMCYQPGQTGVPLPFPLGVEQDGDPDVYPSPAVSSNIECATPAFVPGLAVCRPTGEENVSFAFTAESDRHQTAIFLETIRDFDIVGPILGPLNTDVQHTIAHELGHAPGGRSALDDHQEGGIMTGGAPRTQNQFSNRTLDRFRSSKTW